MFSFFFFFLVKTQWFGFFFQVEIFIGKLMATFPYKSRDTSSSYKCVINSNVGSQLPRVTRIPKYSQKVALV